MVTDLVDLAVRGGADVLGPMPNTQAGLHTAQDVLGYIDTLKKSQSYSKGWVNFTPIVLLTDEATPQMIDECVKAGIVDCKIYPLYRTTQSHNGVRWYQRLLPTVKHCGKVGMKVHTHPEHPWFTIQGRDAELIFQSFYDMLLNKSEAIIVSEHGTDGRCAVLWE